MATIETFNFTATELAERYTMTCHDTIRWVLHEKLITEKQADDLLGRMIVTAIPNRAGWGSKILKRLGFTSITDESNTWIFPIVLLPNVDFEKRPIK